MSLHEVAGFVELPPIGSTRPGPLSVEAVRLLIAVCRCFMSVAFIARCATDLLVCAFKNNFVND